MSTTAPTGTQRPTPEPTVRLRPGDLPTKLIPPAATPPRAQVVGEPVTVRLKALPKAISNFDTNTVRLRPLIDVPDVATAGFVYYRLRRPEYAAADIDRWGRRAGEHLAAGRDAYVMLKHEDDPGGALQAERLLAAAP